MENNQLLLTIAITITTIFVVVAGLQLLFMIRELRREMKKSGHGIWKQEKHSDPVQKKKILSKKTTTIHSVLDKIRIFSSNSRHENKRFFIKEN